jgi:MFS family permease
MLGLGAYRHRATGELSTGTRRIVELGCIVGHKPSLLMLDEPTAGVAQAETEALGPLLRTIANEIGCAMVVIEHDMTMISNLCDRLVALELGGIIAEGPPAKVLASDAVISSYLGTNETSVARSGRRPAAETATKTAAKTATKTAAKTVAKTAAKASATGPKYTANIDEAAVLSNDIPLPAEVPSAEVLPSEGDQKLSTADGGGGRVANFRAGLGPVGLTALFVLAGLAVAQSFDSNAFGVLAPEIQKTFHLDNAGIDSVSGLTAALPLLGAVFIGNLGDRKDRIKITRWSGVLWGVTAILTGIAPVLAILVVARLLGGIGLLSSQTIYPSLLSDYYPEEKRAPVFTVFLLASVGLGLVAGPFAGVLGNALGWRSTFVLLAVPTFIFVALLKRLQDPRREQAGPGAATPASGDITPDTDATDTPSPEVGNMRESFRAIRAVRTLRRIWLGAFILGGAAAPMGTLVSTYLKDVYGTGATARGFILAVVGLGGLVGLVLSGGWAHRVVGAQKPDSLAVVTGAAAFTFGVFLLVFAVVPTLWIAVVFGFLAGIGLGGFLPPYTTLVSLVTPVYLRSQAYAWSTVFFACGAVLVAVTVGTLADSAGQRLALSVLAVLVLIGGAVVVSARRFVDADLHALGLDDGVDLLALVEAAA